MGIRGVENKLTPPPGDVSFRYKRANAPDKRGGQRQQGGRGCPKCRKANAINPKAKSVIQMSLDGTIIAEYPSAAEAERQTGIKSIHKVCRCEGKTAGGFIWKYKTDNDDKEKE